ncbi:MAG: phosphonoacetaldehyde reductase [Candidatus Paceibacterota bacterium]|jgi:alcohol dehydrogenase class IV
MSRSYAGKGRLNKLGTVLRECNARRIFLVTGKMSYENSNFRKKIEKVFKDKVYFRYSDFVENPQYDDIITGIQEIKNFLPDIIIGIGGGSVLDTAKLLSVFFDNDTYPLEVITGQKPVPKRKVPLVLIPTTAGSGSECTHFAVLYLGGKKYSVVSKSLLPDYTIVDSELTYTAPKYLTAVTAFDALSHAIESYWSVSSTKKSREYSAESIRLIVEIFDTLVVKPDGHSREVMMKAAHLSGKAINITKTTAAHALSYGFTVRYGIPHGQAVMLTLPRLFIHNAGAVATSLNLGVSYQSHKQRMKDLCLLLGKKNAKEAAYKLESMIKKAKIDYHLNCLETDKKKEVEAIVAEVNLDRLHNNPVLITRMELENIVNPIFSNKPQIR